MKSNFISGIMAGFYIALGAMTFLIIPNPVVATLFFATGIFLVFNFSNMLFTRVCPLMAATKEYNVIDLTVTWFGNAVGAFLTATLCHFCRFEGKILDRLQPLVEAKLSDTPVSLFIMGIICAIFVSYAVFLGRKYPLGSFPQIFFVWLLITAFVYGGYDHIVANFYYLSAYGWAFKVPVLEFAKVIFFVTAGNIAGGILIGKLEKKHLPQ